jgi:transcriptional regulator of met regulon
MAKNAVLANLTIHKYSNEINDRSVAATVARENHASVSEDRYIKKRIPKIHMKKITTIISQITTMHRTWTSPWFDGGIRILPAKLVLKYLAKMKEFRKELDIEVERVSEELRAIDAENQRTRGTLYNPNEIPDKEVFCRAFFIDFTILPFSTANDFRVDIITDQMKKKYEDTMAAKLSLNTPHVVNLFRDPIDRLSNTTRYYQSTLDKLQFAVDVAPDMILDEDLHDQVEQLCNTVEDNVLCFAVEDIRSDQNVQERFLEGLDMAKTEMRKVHA